MLYNMTSLLKGNTGERR